MSGARTYFLHGAGQYVEHDKWIDFRSAMRHCNWRMMAFLPIQRAVEVHGALQDRGLTSSFIVDTRILSGQTMAFVFRPILRTDAENAQARRALMNVLNTYKLRIIYKEHHHGYEIDARGHILRKWGLGKQRCKPLCAALSRPPQLPLGPLLPAKSANQTLSQALTQEAVQRDFPNLGWDWDH